MKHTFRTIIIAAVSLMGSTFIPLLKADESDLKTTITIDQSIDIQGTVLPPGSYVIKLLDSSADRHIVQIFNVDQKHLIATVLAIPAYRQHPGNTDFQFYPTPAGQPQALHTWFYPGDEFGFEFRASHMEALALARLRQAKATTSSGRSD
jgi:hypothetical protein